MNFFGHLARPATAIAGLIIALAVAQTSPADDRIPFVGLRENSGHLRFETCLPAGRGSFEAIDPSGLQLTGFVFVTGASQERRPRIFRLRGESTITAGQSSKSDLLPPFLIKLRTSPNPDHYELSVEVEHTVAGQSVCDHAVLGRNCCGYYVTATNADRKLPVGRGALLTDVMVSAPETYRQFERLAAICCRPGFEFVPGSLFSPSIVEEVIAADEAAPTAEAQSHFQHLLGDLDSDRFTDREAATSQLIDGGRTTLWSLDHLADRDLSAEQRQRLVKVRQALSEWTEPTFPFDFSGSQFRDLSEYPPRQWLATLCQSPDSRVSTWARKRSESSSSTAPADQPKH